ncbi:MAG: hypothetical protein H8E12_17440 [Rhodobacteraceae bacterium]|nr:hypothetical protein [Paracoccaceae bacterium]
MSIPMYGQNKNGDALEAVKNLFVHDFPTEGKGFMFLTGTKVITGGDTTSDQGKIIDVKTDSTIQAGYIKVSGVQSGAIDFDLGLVAEASTLGSQYGNKGNGVYGFRLIDFVDISTPENVYLSVDGNTCGTNERITIEVGILVGVIEGTA